MDVEFYLKKSPRSGRIRGDSHTGAGGAFGNSTTHRPTTQELRDALAALGFSFELARPGKKRANKHPGLRIFLRAGKQNIELPVWQRFKLMRLLLKGEGIRPPRGLSRVCYMAAREAWEGDK